MAEENKTAVTSASMMSVGIGGVALGISLFAAGKYVEGIGVAAIGFVALFMKYKCGF
jgi:hypothetical protein